MFFWFVFQFLKTCNISPIFRGKSKNASDSGVFCSSKTRMILLCWPAPCWTCKRITWQQHQESSSSTFGFEWPTRSPWWGKWLKWIKKTFLLNADFWGKYENDIFIISEIVSFFLSIFSTKIIFSPIFDSENEKRNVLFPKIEDSKKKGMQNLGKSGFWQLS